MDQRLHHYEFFEDDEEDQRIDLIDIQKRTLTSMLQLNPSEEDEEEQEVEICGGLVRIDKRILTFKLLVYDQTAQNVVATIMKVGALRDCNVTLHLNLTSKREPVPDIPAVYLICNANEAALKRIAEDAMNGTYDYFFINFMKPVTAEQIDAFAYEMAKTNAAHKICKVESHYLNYQVISPSFFVIPNGKENFKQLLTDSNSDLAIDHIFIFYGLFSLFKSIGRVPLVRVVNQDVSERVFRKLAALYQLHKDSEISPSQTKKQDRPLLIVLDRNLDLHTMFYHSWTYLTLLQDIFSIKNNQFQFFEDAKAQPVTYELDFQSDDILRHNAFKDFHEAAENVDKSMSQWKEEYDLINKKAGAGEVTDIINGAINLNIKSPLCYLYNQEC